jgi:hypothetical protein
MISETMQAVLKKDGVVAIGTMGADGMHMVNTWNSYVQITEDGRLLIPAGYFHKTEANVAANDQVLLTMGSSKVPGLNGPGAGVLVKGKAAFVTAGADFDRIKSRFKWARAALVITIESETQTI